MHWEAVLVCVSFYLALDALGCIPQAQLDGKAAEVDKAKQQLEAVMEGARTSSQVRRPVLLGDNVAACVALPCRPLLKPTCFCLAAWRTSSGGSSSCKMSDGCCVRSAFSACPAVCLQAVLFLSTSHCLQLQ